MKRTQNASEFFFYKNRVIIINNDGLFYIYIGVYTLYIVYCFDNVDNL